MTTSIMNTAGYPADHHTTMQQIGSGNLMACGARHFVHDNPNGLLMFRVGAERSLRKVMVRLMPNDTYSVEVGKTNRKTMEYVVEDQEHGIYADQVGASVRRLGDR